MSIEWRYESSNDSFNDGIIDIIYCSNIEMTIPIQYFWTILLKDGREYDLTNPILSKIITSLNDLNVLNIARQNYLYLHKLNVN